MLNDIGHLMNTYCVPGALVHVSNSSIGNS